MREKWCGSGVDFLCRTPFKGYETCLIEVMTPNFHLEARITSAHLHCFKLPARMRRVWVLLPNHFQ